MSAKNEVLAALTHGDLVHVLTLQRAGYMANTIYVIHCGGYATSAVFGESTYPTCVACAADYDYWREDVR